MLNRLLIGKTLQISQFLFEILEVLEIHNDKINQVIINKGL